MGLNDFILKYEKSIGLFVTTIGALIANIQGSSLILALPDLLVDLDATLITLLWVLISYLLTTTVVVPIAGSFADQLGRRRIFFNIGLFIFTAFSLILGLAPDKQYNGWDMVIYRIFQGIGAAFMFANSTPIITDLFIGPKLGIAIGINQIALASGFVLGPVVGGLLTDVSWRWVYLINVPIGGVGCIIGFIFLRDRPKKPATDPEKGQVIAAPENVMDKLKKIATTFDWLGAFLFLASLTCLLTVVSEAAFNDMSTTSLIIVGVIAGVLLIAFIITELKVTGPLIHLELFSHRAIALPIAGTTFLAFSRVLVTFGTLFFFQGPYGQDPFQAGISQLPFGIGLLIMSFVSGSLMKKTGAWWFCLFGPFVMAGGIVGFCFISESTPYINIAVFLAMVGIGSGMYNSPNTASLMSAADPKQRGIIGSLVVTTANFCAMISIVVVFKMVLGSIPPDDLGQLFLYGGGGLQQSVINTLVLNFNNSMWIAFGIMLLPFTAVFFYKDAPYWKQPPAEGANQQEMQPTK